MSKNSVTTPVEDTSKRDICSIKEAFHAVCTCICKYRGSRSLRMEKEKKKDREGFLPLLIKTLSCDSLRVLATKNRST